MILNYSVVLGLLFALVQITVGAKDTKERYPSPRASDHSPYKRPSATRPGDVSSASNQNTTPERQSRPIPGSLQGLNQRPGLPRRPQSQPSPLRPSFQGQDLNRGTFYPQSQRPKSIAERIPQRAPAVDFKPFDNPSENIEQEGPGPLPQRPVRNPSQYGPEAVEEDFSKGFPPGFIDNLPNFNFQGNLPDAPAGESRGFLDGFSNFPNFRTVGGFDPLGPPPEDAVSGSSDSGDYRPSNLKKRNPEDNLQRPERYPSPETRDARALGYSSKIMLRRTRRDASAFPTTKTSSIYSDYLLQNSSENYKKSKKRQFSSKSKNRYNKVKSIPQTESRNVTGVENSKDKQKFISSKDKQKTISRDHSDMAYMDEDKGDEVLLGDAFFKKETDAEPDNTDTEPDNTASEQRFFPRRKNRRQNDFPSFELFRPFFDDFHAKPERPSPPPRRFRPRPPSSHEFHYDGSDNSILGSGNFIVLPGGTFKDYADYHDDYYYNNEYRPYRPEYNGDFFANFKDFADINAHRRRLINVRNDKF